MICCDEIFRNHCFSGDAGAKSLCEVYSAIWCECCRIGWLQRYLSGPELHIGVGWILALNMYLSCGNVAWWHLFDCASWSSLTLPRLLSQRSEQQQTHEQSWNQLQNCMIVKAWGVSPPKMASATCITSLKWKGCCKVAVETCSNWLPGAIGWVSGNLLSQVLQDHDITMTQKIELTLQSLPMFFHGSLAISIWLKASL